MHAWCSKHAHRYFQCGVSAKPTSDSQETVSSGSESGAPTQDDLVEQLEEKDRRILQLEAEGLKVRHAYPPARG